MKIDLISAGGERVPAEIPEGENYPEIIFTGVKAFKKHPQTDDYVECDICFLGDAFNIRTEYYIAYIALVRASEHLALLISDTNTGQPIYSSLTWRLRCVTEALTFIKSRSLDQIEEFLKEHYPKGM